MRNTSAAGLPRPTLLPGLRPLWRDRHRVQLGIDPAHAVVLELPHPAAARLLELLDGSRTERAVIQDMARLGMQAEHTRSVIAELAEAGLVTAAHTLMPAALPAQRRAQLTDEATALAIRLREQPATPAELLRRRDGARVIVAGSGRLASLLIQTLSASGIGTIGQISGPGGTARVVTQRATARAKILRATDATFVVRIGSAARVAPRRTRRLTPHLAISFREAVAIVGPLVLPGQGPCLGCLDLHRTDNDPAWPRLAAQLDASDPVPCGAATLTTAAGFAAAEVLAHLDGGTASTAGVTVEINGCTPWRRRAWARHPRCICARRRNHGGGMITAAT